MGRHKEEMNLFFGQSSKGLQKKGDPWPDLKLKTKTKTLFPLNKSSRFLMLKKKKFT